MIHLPSLEAAVMDKLQGVQPAMLPSEAIALTDGSLASLQTAERVPLIRKAVEVIEYDGASELLRIHLREADAPTACEAPAGSSTWESEQHG